MKLTKWQKKLTAAQRKHAKEQGGTSLAGVRRNVEFQAGMACPCWECVEIGRRLGIDVELAAFHAHRDQESL